MTNVCERQRLLTVLAAACLVALLSGCGAKKKEFVYYSWPLPPDQPKIAYVTSYYGAPDFASLRFIDTILGGDPQRSLEGIFGIAMRGDLIYVAETGGQRVSVIDPVKKEVTYIGDRGRKKLEQPVGLALDADGRLYVADAGQKAVLVYDQTGKQTQVFGKGVLERPCGVAVNDALGRIYVTDVRSHSIKVYNLQGEPLFEIGKRGTGDGEFNFPLAVKINKRNNDLYVLDSQNHRVQVLDQDGTFRRKWGKPGDELGDFMLPKSLAVDGQGQVYVTDAGCNCVHVFTPTAEPVDAFGGTGSAPGAFRNPADLFIDDNDRIYVSDPLNYRVQVFQSMTEKWKKENLELYQKYLDHWEAEAKKMEEGKAPAGKGAGSKPK